MPCMRSHSAKRLSRRLERRWKTSDLDTDRTTYRAAYRMANKAINESRRSQYSQRISECVDSTQRWATIKNILHSCDSDNSHTEDENLKLCHSFADCFVNKINDLKKTIEARLLLLQGPVFQDVPYSGTPLQNLPPVAPSENLKLRLLGLNCQNSQLIILWRSLSIMFQTSTGDASA